MSDTAFATIPVDHDPFDSSPPVEHINPAGGLGIPSIQDGQFNYQGAGDSLAPQAYGFEPVEHDPFAGMQMAEQPSSQPENNAWPSSGMKPVDRLFGLGGQERYQTWPERMIRSAVSLPNDMMTGAEQYVPGLRREDVTDNPKPGGWTVAAEPNDPVIERAQDIAGMAMSGTLANPAVHAGETVLGAGPMRKLQKVTGPVESDPSYVYHATSADRVPDIIESGGLKTNKPNEFTDQSSWPDGSTQKRNYFTPTAENTWQFAPEDGSPALLRVAKDGHPLKVESTGDLYSTKTVPASKIEALTEDGWRPLNALYSDSGEIGAPLSALEHQPPFYSAVGQAVDNSPLKKGQPSQWLGTIKNTPGVKSEELQWLGLDDWLKDQKGPVTKEAVQNFVKANQIEVQDVEKGTTSYERALNARAKELGEAENGAGSWDRLGGAGQEHYFRDARREFSGSNWDQHGGLPTPPNAPSPPKYPTYQLPGGENYREMLLTLPPDGGQKASAARGKMADQLRAKYGDNFPEHWTEAEKSQWMDTTTSDQYRSSHWDEPNVLAHARFNDRTIDGKNALFLEEIQSDWHQKGRRVGYQNSQPPDLSGWKAKEHEGYPGYYEVSGPRGESLEEVRANSPDEAIRHAAGQQFDIPGSPAGAVPDAPFKTSWPELTLKRMIRYAAENGYDKIAWTPGDVQAARYDMSKQLKAISATDNGDGTYGLVGATQTGGTHPFGSEIPKDKLSDYVGKDLAQKIIDAKPAGKYAVRGNGPWSVINEDGQGVYGKTWDDFNRKEAAERQAKLLNNTTKFSGVDLQVGGEGMEGFYDQILPSMANKIGKKFGAKVEQKTIPSTGEEINRYEGPEPTTEDIYKVLKASKGLGDVYDSPITGKRQVYPITNVSTTRALEAVYKRMADNNISFSRAMSLDGNHNLAEIFGGEMVKDREIKSQPVHSMDITPAMRAQAMKGFPLFARGGRVLPYGPMQLVPIDHDPFI